MAFWLAVQVWGQRSVGMYDPKDLEPDLVFDTNNRPVRAVSLTGADQEIENDLNASPNVVFSPDSTKAFVSFSGSDKVGVFNPKTGQPIALIQVGANPGPLTVTPDGQEVAVVSRFLKRNLFDTQTGTRERIGSISLIDVETLEVRSLELEGVEFSAVNNIVFSQQGEQVFGFIASAGTDQILRFDLMTATEILPRIDFVTYTRPSTITLSPDGSFFAVVLIGGSGLAIEDTPDSVQIVDAATFRVRRSIVPDVESRIDFLSVNNVTFSADGKLGLIAEQAVSSRLGNRAAVVDDRALLFNVDTGEIEEILAVGGGAGFSTLTPDGSAFVVVSILHIDLIDVATRNVRSLLPLQSDYQPSTRPVFSRQQDLMYIAAPIDDVIVAINWSTPQIDPFIDRILPVGGMVERQIGDVSFQVSSAPLNLAIAPDGETMTAVNFNANTVELFVDTQKSFLPLALTTDTWFTSAAVTNVTDRPADIIATGRDPTSVLFRNDVDPSITNPVRICGEGPREVDDVCRLGPQEQAIFTFRDLINPSPGEELRGWVEFDSDRWNLGTLFLTGDREVRRLDGFAGGFQGALKVLVSELKITGGFQTELTVLNPQTGANSISIKLFNSAGEELAEEARALPSHFMLVAKVRGTSELPGIFLPEAFEDFTDGYLLIEGGAPLYAVVRCFDPERLVSVAGFPLDPEQDQAARLFAPQVVEFEGFRTQLTMIHTGSEPLEATLTLKGDRNQDVAGPITISLGPSEMQRRNVAELFGLADPGGLLTGWIVIETDRPGLLGTVEVGSAKTMTTIPLQNANREFIFPYVANQHGVSTGLALINSETETADVRIELVGADARPLANKTVSLLPNHRTVQPLHEFFPGLPAFSGGVVRFSSDRELVGLEILYQNQLEYFSAIPVQVVDSADPD